MPLPNDFRGLARWANSGGIALVSAEMAAETTVGPMEGQGNAAVLALFDMPAFGTEHGGVEPSTV
jgi:hypothetical protein